MKSDITGSSVSVCHPVSCQLTWAQSSVSGNKFKLDLRAHCTQTGGEADKPKQVHSSSSSIHLKLQCVIDWIMFATRQLKSLSTFVCVNLKQCAFPPSYTAKNFCLTPAPHAWKNDGVDIGDPDQVDAIEEALAAEKYNSLYFKLNRQIPSMKIDTNHQQVMLNGIETDLDSVEEIDSYEKLFLDSYNEHSKNFKVEQTDGKGRTLSPAVEGRLWVGDAGSQLIEGCKVLEQAEVAASLIAKRSGDLVADHFPSTSPRLVIKVQLDQDATHVLVTVGLSEGEEEGTQDCRTEAYTACAVALANIYHAVKDAIPKDSISSIKILDG